MVSLSDRIPILLFASAFWQTDAAAYSIDMAWSPDNQHIASTSVSDAVMELSVLDTLKPTQRVTVKVPVTPDTRYSQPVWFADGIRLLARVSDRESGLKGSRFLVIDSLNSVQKASVPIPLFSYKNDFWLSPTGQWVIFKVDGAGGDKDGLYVMKTDGSGLKYLMKNSGFPDEVDWSPDGQRAFINNAPLSYDNQPHGIQWLDTTDMNLQSAFKGQQDFLGWHWSPDSQSLLVCQVTQRDERNTATAGKLWLVPVVAGRSPVVLLNTLLCPDYWLP